ncbi:MAG: hypothetical protein GY870_08865 [archaeon]|nr:hypothetical protein [archaeon]
MVSEKMTLARVRIQFPEQLWISEIYKSFPDLNMRILHLLPSDMEKSIGNTILEIFHHKVNLIIKKIENHDSVIDFSILEQERNRIKINVKVKNAFILDAIIKNGILVNFPVSFYDGYAFWRFISSRKQIDKLLSYFEKMKINFSILNIGNSPYTIDKNEYELSLDEKSILEKAIINGFFEVPRKISLEGLANKLGVSKSSLSVTLRKIIKKKVLVAN